MANLFLAAIAALNAIPKAAWGYLIAAGLPLALSGWLYVQLTAARADVQTLATSTAQLQAKLTTAEFQGRQIELEREQCVTELDRMTATVKKARAEKERITTDFDRLKAEIAGLDDRDCLTALEKAIRGQ